MDQILYHGTFLTMDDSNPSCEAVLVENGTIRAVGELKRLEEMSPKACLKDMGGHTVLPGFIDGHSHITAVACGLLLANLKPSPLGTCDSVEDLVRELKDFFKTHEWKPGQWLMGMGYDNSVFPEGIHPTRFDLDKVSTEIPIAATHISGHMAVVNTKGMELLGYLGEAISVPSGGVVKQSGLLKEEAFLSRMGDMKGPDGEAVAEAVAKASKLYASYGLTTVHDGKAGKEQIELLKAAGQGGSLFNDVAAYLTPEAARELLPRENPGKNPYENHLRLAGVKLFLDGSPQGKTAWLSQPYYVVPENERPDYCGFPVQTQEYVLKTMKECLKNHWQINVHANGDAAIEQMIDCYEQAWKETKSREDLRPVVIHCQTVREDQLKRMKTLGMLASFFHDHVYYWGDYHYESVLGPERASRISPLQSALRHGVPFTLHQDSPVAPPDVMGAVYNAVTRKTLKGRILGPDQRIDVMEALKAVTINGAYQLFEEERKGSIVPGKMADFVVLSDNPLKTAKEGLKEIKVLETIKEGKTVYSRDCRNEPE